MSTKRKHSCTKGLRRYHPAHRENEPTSDNADEQCVVRQGRAVRFPRSCTHEHKTRLSFTGPQDENREGTHAQPFLARFFSLPSGGIGPAPPTAPGTVYLRHSTHERTKHRSKGNGH